MFDLSSFWIGVGAVVILYIIRQGFAWLERRASKNWQVDPKLMQQGMSNVFRKEYTTDSDISKEVFYRDAKGDLHNITSDKVMQEILSNEI